eukprot:c25393_g1_i1 orf=219-908(+)
MLASRKKEADMAMLHEEMEGALLGAGAVEALVDEAGPDGEVDIAGPGGEVAVAGPEAGAIVGTVVDIGVIADDGAIPGLVELTGPGTGTPSKLQRLVGGVWSLQAGGSCWARVTLTPRGSVKVVLKRRQRHCGLLVITDDSSVQQAAGGVFAAPITNDRQSVKVSTTVVQSTAAGEGAGACAATPPAVIVISSRAADRHRRITPSLILQLPINLSLSLLSLSYGLSSVV